MVMRITSGDSPVVGAFVINANVYYLMTERIKGDSCVDAQVYIPGMNWGDRIRQYNNFISGNTEPLSISSDDSIWDSDCEQHDVGCADEKGSLAQGPLTASPQAAPPCGVKRRLFDSPDSSPPAFKKYKTSMLLRYIGADERESPGGGSQAASRQPRPLTAKRPREEQQPAAKTAEPKKAAREGTRTVWRC
ncbi:hypothetical protein V5799_021334 [Amblyomma americanum]|uniref:Uncharacterized protein n=1 Tax=Amblyomma americanum TaxID=6943 RepID=A0AAQ4FNT9_AMBAM